MSIHHRIILAALAALVLGASAIPASAKPIALNGNGYVVRAQTAAISGTPGVPPILPTVNASQLAKIEQAEPQASAYTPPKGAQYSNAEMNAYRADPQPVTTTGAGSASRTSPCSGTCLRSVDQTTAAELGFDSGSGGQALAAELGFNRGSVGQAPAAELGFNRGSAGQALAAELGFNPRPVGQAQRSEAASGGRHANPTALATEPGVPPSGGFDWGDAGIGAASALGLTMLLAGAVLVTTKARRRPTRNTAQPTG